MKKILWFSNLENKIWGENINTNKYYASLSIFLTALIGALFALSTILQSPIDEDNIIWIILFIFLPNLAESIFATNSIKITILRTLLIGIFTALAAVLGYIGAIVVAIIATLFILLLAFSLFSSGIGPSSSSKSRSPRSYAYDENGSEVTLTDEGGGYARDEYGHRWKNAGGTRWTKDE